MGLILTFLQLPTRIRCRDSIRFHIIGLGIPDQCCQLQQACIDTGQVLFDKTGRCGKHYMVLVKVAPDEVM
jgi:hypothetical protein